MAHYRGMNDDDDDSDIVIQEGTEKLEKCTRRLHSKIGLLETRDSPALRKQIEEEHRRGQDVVAEVKAEIRGAPKTSRVAAAERGFRAACDKFRQAFADFKNGGSSSGAAVFNDEDHADYGGDGGGGRPGEIGASSHQVVTMLMESEDVDALLEQENRDDALRLAQDTAILRETMADTNALIQEGGEQLLGVDETMEEAVEAAEGAADELTKAREHQKQRQRCMLIFGSICGVIILFAIVIPLIMAFGTPAGSNPLNPSVTVTGTILQQSSAPETCETSSDTMCQFRCGQSGYGVAVTDSTTMTLTPSQSTLSSTGCESFACPTGSATVSGTTATGSFSDSFGTTFTASPSAGKIVFAEQTGSGRATTCSATFTVSVGTVLGVSAP